MATVKSLEDFLKKHRNITNSASPKSLSEYMNSKGIRPMQGYATAVRGAINTGTLASGNYGKSAEALWRAGLSDGGYAEYLERAAKEKAASDISTAKEKAESEYISAVGGYEKYLQNYRRVQDDKMLTLEKQLVNMGIMRIDETYAIGIDYGLSPDDAATVSASVYRALRDGVFDKCITAAQSAYMSEDGIRGYAERMGLLPEDIDELLWEVGRFLNEGKSGDYVTALRSQANK